MAHPSPWGNSYLKNDLFIPKHEQGNQPMFYGPVDPNGSVFAYLDGYLICPMEMFTKEEIEVAARRYRGH